MRLRPIAAVVAIAAAALVTGGIGITMASAENGHGFNCTPGNPANAENHHEINGKDDNGNGDDCLQEATVSTTTTTVAPTPTPTAAPSTAAVQPAAAQAATEAPSAAAVRAQPRLTG